MGVPKFFRYISERYPCLSELVKDYQLPEFDNLYLDMNGIIHNCSHPNDEDPHFRITEEKIFKDIFHYIEVLFRMIKPQKLFFMAVDGVAPRAKMNQQRGRRFRSAADAAKAEADAINKGEQLPTEARFDSNCITPGTLFMDKLHEQLKYFVVDKISNDPLWQKCKVILSGHETPGEGEHKIMDYIRYMRVQPGYDPNTRHCLYGLDADLMMLGLCTHEPHFSLLREEVKFGRKDTKRITVPEEITFFLLHLSLLREYLELEFAPIKYNLRSFVYDFEKIIDDWVLMGFLVGNDFIPHLPNLHIAEGALPILYKIYMEVLPTLDGYINEEGKLNLKRFEIFLQKLGAQDLVNFEQVRDDLSYLESKRGRNNDHLKKCIEEWEAEDDNVVFESLEPAKDSGLEALLKFADTLCLDDEPDDSNESDEDEFAKFKRDYYKQKLEYKDVTPEVLRDQAEGFVRAIQWNLNYYYNGCCSWSWFYPHHYSPYISDIKGFTNMNIEFDMGKPFYPYEQLLAVLPAASKQLLPECYHRLMTEESSIIFDYYPEQFECDLNGKKQSWEAVVKIPFIDEKLLLEAMSYCNDKLTTDEKRRNSHGPMLVYTFTPRNNGPYPSPCYFPEVAKNHTELKTLMYGDVLIPREKLIKGPYPGAHLDIYYPGFPTMKHLQYKGELQMAHVKVFEQPSRNESMIVKIIPDVRFTGDLIPVDFLGTLVFIGWPHLIEASVVAISNKKKKFICMGGPNQYNVHDLKESDIKEFNMSINGITEHYKTRMGIECGDTKVLVYVKQVIGKKFTFANGKLLLEKQFAENTSCFPFQTIVSNITAHDPQKNVIKEVENIFPKNSICFTLANPYYGSQGVIEDSAQVGKTGRIKISISVLEEPKFSVVKDMFNNVFRKYKPAHAVASRLCISNVLFSKMTGAILIKVGGEENQYKRVNVGLDLKLNKKNKETPGYTKKVNNCWLYTEKAADLVEQYMEKFPQVLEFVSRHHHDEDITIEKLFPIHSEQKFKELREWLKTLPTEKIEKSPCNSIGLEPDAILELEKIVDSFENVDVKKVTMHIKPNFLYRPEVQTGTLEPDPKTKTEILDRIVNVRHGYSVPFGFKGTITAIRNSNSSTNSERDTMYEVVFDQPFGDGLKLNCSVDNRGYILPKTAFINISYGQRLMEQKTGKPDELIAKAEAYNSRKNNNQKNNSFNELIRPQPSFQQQWFSSSQKPPLLAHQSHPTLNPSNSAFAHFSNCNHPQRSPSMNNGQKAIQQLFNRHLQCGTTNNENKKIEKENANHNNNPECLSLVVEENALQLFNKHQQDINKAQPDDKDAEAKLATTNKDNQVTLAYQKNKEFYEKRDESSSSGSSKENNTENWRQQSKQSFEQNRQHNTRNKGQVNIFMPNFGDNNKEMTANISSRKTATVDTDFLKNILGIGKDEKGAQSRQNKPTGNKENAETKAPSNNVKEPKSTNVSFDMLAQVAKTPATVRLLTYYQSNLLGLPRYQYFSVQNKMVCAQITLNDGRVMHGDAAKNREDASEKVAAIVLDELLKKGKSPSQIVNVSQNIIPTPPVNWVQSQSKENEARQYPKSSEKPKKHTAKAAGNSEMAATSAVLNNSFVPLQAVKSHISKSSGTNSSNSIQNENVKESVSGDGAGEKETGGKRKIIKEQNQEQKRTNTVQKPKKERKTRIAANFLNKN